MAPGWFLRVVLFTSIFGLGVFSNPGANLPLPRSANRTLRMPADLPISGYGLVDAFGPLQFQQPVSITTPPGETNRIFIAERTGRILVITNLASPTLTVFLDLRESTYTNQLETGLLGLAWHPGFATNGYFFVCRSLIRSTEGNPSTLHQQLSRFQTAPEDSNLVLTNSEVPLIAQADQVPEHNAGDIQFGPDGYLYVGFGDLGPSPKDNAGSDHPLENGFFGAIARLDVDQRPGCLPANPHPANLGNYWVPPDNPFVDTTEHRGFPVDRTKSRTEFYAIGFRNPWRMAFDSETGDLFCGDVGNLEWEEVDRVKKGGDHGWPRVEGYVGASDDFPTVTPVLVYGHGYGSKQGLAVVGGFFYRGRNRPELAGKYIFGDFGSGNIWSLGFDDGIPVVWDYLSADPGLSAFGMDPRNGDILVANHSRGTLRRLIYVAPAEVTSLPATLADTGIFTDVATLAPAPGVVPFSVNVPFWSDAALKSRWFCLPNPESKIQFNSDSNWGFPTGTVWVKHFELELTRGDAASRRRVETRVLVKTLAGLYGLTYRWDGSATNAMLVPEEGMDEEFQMQDGEDSRVQAWRYPSRTECLFCHTPEGGYALGFNTRQLNRASSFPDNLNQIEYLRAAGYLEPAPELLPAQLPALAGPKAAEYPLGYRARSYLSANCVQCHQPGASAGATWDARITTPLTSARIIDSPATYFGAVFGPATRVIAPGDVEHSMIPQWMSWRGSLQMPPMSTTVADQSGLDLIGNWINSLPASPWRDATLGQTPLQGYASVLPDGFSLSSSLSENSTGASSYYVLSRPLPVNGHLLARLTNFRTQHRAATAGLLARFGDGPEAPFVAILQQPDGATFFQRRTRGHAMETRRLAKSPTPPAWLRLARHHPNFIAYTSTDGELWTVAGTFENAESLTAEAGFTLVPSELNRFATANFADVEFVSATIKEPLPGQTFNSTTGIVIRAEIVVAANDPVKTEVLADAQKIGEFGAQPYEWRWENPAEGTHQLRIRITNARGTAVLSDPIAVTVTPAPSSAQFRNFDVASAGNWRGVYGLKGYVLPGAPPDLDSGISFAATTLPVGSWEKLPLSQERLLQLPQSAGRTPAVWRFPGPLVFQLRFDDALPHQVAAYFLDGDTSNQRVQQVEVFDLNSGTRLAAQEMDRFSNGKYLIWGVRGDIQIRVTSRNDLVPVLSGIFVDPLFNRLPVVQLSGPAEPVRLPQPVTLTAEASDPDGLIQRVEFWEGTSLLGTALTAPFTLQWTSGHAGEHSILARAFDDFNDYTDSRPVTVQIKPSLTEVEFVGVDTQTGGRWKGDFNGHAIAGISTNLPPYVSIAFESVNELVWANDSRAPAAFENLSGNLRTASTWYGEFIPLRIDFKDGAVHWLALYFLDWDSGERIAEVVFLDPELGNILDTRRVSQSGSGKHYVWRVRGPVYVIVRPQNMNAILSALFIDPVNASDSMALNWLPPDESANSLLRLTGPPTRSIQLRFSPDLREWSPVSISTIPLHGTVTLPGLLRRDLGAGFYRVELLPETLSSD